MSVKLSQIESQIKGAHLSGSDVTIAGVSHDSRRIIPGFAFAAVRGATQNGIDFVPNAVRQGASALIVADKYRDAFDLPNNMPVLFVPSVRQSLGAISCLIYNFPSEKLDLVGITGTNGKTTTSFLLDAALTNASFNTGIIGTIEFRSANRRSPSTFTTPEAPDLQALLAEMVENKVDVVSMEVSSHGLDQRRVDGTRFKVGVFTNLTSEHLDYHGTIEQYFYTKAQLFTPDRCEFGIINIDDPWGRRLASQLSIPHLTFGTSTDANFRIADIIVSADGTRFTLVHDAQQYQLNTKIVGALNAMNATAAFLAALQLGADPVAASLGIASCQAVSGRFQQIDAGQPALTVVDYAHTPDSISDLIATVRRLIPQGGRVFAIGGARGGRDRLKRPNLGRALSTSDLAIITTDSPGEEDPNDIISQIVLGTLDSTPRHVHVEPNRIAAIEYALKNAGSEDAIVIVGRGHETTIRVGNSQIHMDDREIVAQVAKTLFGATSEPLVASWI